MQDIYIEHMVKRRPNVLFKAIFIFSVVMAVVSLLLFLALPLMIISLVLFIVLAYFARMNSELEYEYAYTNDSMDVDVVYNHERRKRLCAFDMADVLSVRRYSIGQPLNGIKPADYSSREEGNDLYLIEVDCSGKKQSIIIEPSDEMVEAMRRKYPRLFM